MPNFTPNYNLIKPSGSENFSVTHANSNSDKIDIAIKKADFEARKALQKSRTNGSVFVAHRGLDNAYPENTLLSIEKACQAGFKIVEFDIIPTSDQVLVLMHDTTVDRTTNGTGTVTSKTLSEIKSLTIDGGVGANRQIGLKVPTLEEVLELLRKYNVTPMVEFKVINNYSQLNNIIDLLKKYNFEYDSIIISPVTYLIEEFRNRGGKSECLLLSDRNVANDNILLNNMPSGYCLNYISTPKELVDEIKLIDLSLAIYTVNEPAVAKQLQNWGVEYITTDTLRGENK